MNITISQRFPDVAIVTSQEPILVDTQSALDLIATVQYETDAKKIVIEKSALHEDFFALSNGMAGEILQKFVTYSTRIAIAGDFSNETSKALADFIWESNRGRLVNFLPTVESCEEALGKS